MCMQGSIELPTDGRSAGRARAFVAERCRAWGLGEICDDLILPVSELITNAIVHARTPALLTLSLTDPFVEVAVQDDSPRPLIPRPVRLDPLGDIDRAAPMLSDQPLDPRDPMLVVGGAGSITAGRGLLIVDAVADEWGVAELIVGKTVWFRIRVPETRSFPSGCRCPSGTSVTPGGLRIDESSAQG